MTEIERTLRRLGFQGATLSPPGMIDHTGLRAFTRDDTLHVYGPQRPVFVWLYLSDHVRLWGMRSPLRRELKRALKRRSAV